MSVIVTILVLIIALLASDAINRLLSRVPGSLMQIIMGVVLALFTSIQIHLDQEWFLLLFIAPLLFNDGKRFPKRELWQLKRPIFENAIFLVFITMFLGGYLIHLIVPHLPLAVSFALAAILSPTDPVAVQSIAKRSHLPSGILHLVSGESLINDASGLIGFKYAVAAAVSGQFILGHAVKDFFYISIVGLISGIVLIYILLTLKNLFYQIGVKGIAFHTVLQLITPLLIYFITEDIFHASGVISVVSAGIVYHLKNHATPAVEPELTLVTEKSWDIIIYVLNGIIFLLLGYSLPKATGTIIKEMNWQALDPIYYAVATWIILFTIRFLWILVYQLWGNRNHKNEGSWRIALLSAFSGVRGAITMVGILSLPFATSAGDAFPQRDLVIFIASVVIILSLLAAIIGIPKLTGNQSSLMDEDEEQEYYSGDLAYYHIIQSVIKQLRQSNKSDNPLCVNWIVWQYQILLHRLSIKLGEDTEARKWMNNQFTLQRVAMDQERKEVQKMYQQRQISKKVAVRLSQIINQRESQSLAMMGQNDSIMRIRVDFNNFRRAFKRWLFNRWNDDDEIASTREAQITLHKSALAEIQHYLERTDINNHDFDEDMINHLNFKYQVDIQRLQGKHNNFSLSYKNLQIKAFGLQRKDIQRLLEADQIDWQTANQLRQKVNYLENVVMQSEN